MKRRGSGEGEGGRLLVNCRGRQPEPLVSLKAIRGTRGEAYAVLLPGALQVDLAPGGEALPSQPIKSGDQCNVIRWTCCDKVSTCLTLVSVHLCQVKGTQYSWASFPCVPGKPTLGRDGNYIIHEHFKTSPVLLSVLLPV